MLVATLISAPSARRRAVEPAAATPGRDPDVAGAPAHDSSTARDPARP